MSSTLNIRISLESLLAIDKTILVWYNFNAQEGEANILLSLNIL